MNCRMVGAIIVLAVCGCSSTTPMNQLMIDYSFTPNIPPQEIPEVGSVVGIKGPVKGNFVQYQPVCGTEADIDGQTIKAPADFTESRTEVVDEANNKSLAGELAADATTTRNVSAVLRASGQTVDEIYLKVANPVIRVASVEQLNRIKAQLENSRDCRLAERQVKQEGMQLYQTSAVFVADAEYIVATARTIGEAGTAGAGLSPGAAPSAPAVTSPPQISTAAHVPPPATGSNTSGSPGTPASSAISAQTSVPSIVPPSSAPPLPDSAATMKAVANAIGEGVSWSGQGYKFTTGNGLIYGLKFYPPVER